MASRQCRSLEDLPMELVTEIAGHVAATSFQPMDDLGRLRATCRVMHHACGNPSVGRHVALLKTYYALLPLLVRVGNPEACTLTGIVDFFAAPQPSLHELPRATASRHNVGAYLYALMMYKNNSGTTDDNITKMYIRCVECEDGSAASDPKKLRNNGCQVCHEEATYLVTRVTWHGHGDLLPPAPVHGDFPCAGGDCGKV
uniref:F-box domain-containing protein n=1 Tax=Setaria italica TaxID=4555 RepID=K3ZE65_SETIT